MLVETSECIVSDVIYDTWSEKETRILPPAVSYKSLGCNLWVNES